MSRKTVIIGEDIGEENVARLRAARPDVDFRVCLDEQSFVNAAADAQIIFSKRFPAEAMKQTERLEWIQTGTSGVNHLWAVGVGERDVLVTNATGSHGTPMSEMILAMMLAFATGVNTMIRTQDSRSPVKPRVLQEKFELAGQTLCVLGLGDIGGTLAHKARLLQMQVIGIRRSRTPFPGLIAQYTPDQLLDALPRADHVALCLPLTDETESIIGETELQAMRPSAHIYNVGRGNSIAPEPLIRSLNEGWITGAGLDVTEPEPLPADSPLWAMDNVILTQHTSGSSPYNADRITKIFLGNLNRYLNGEPLHNVVDQELGY